MSDLDKRTAQEARDEGFDDCISRAGAIDALAKAMPSLTTPDGCGEFDHDIYVTDEAYVDCMQIIHELPSAQPEDWMERNKDRILQAGTEGREIEFRIGGRLFAIREKAQ